MFIGVVNTQLFETIVRAKVFETKNVQNTYGVSLVLSVNITRKKKQYDLTIISVLKWKKHTV